jgi:hypothetical protein
VNAGNESCDLAAAGQPRGARSTAAPYVDADGRLPHAQPRIREKLSDVMSPDRRGGDESTDTNASDWALDG